MEAKHAHSPERATSKSSSKIVGDGEERSHPHHHHQHHQHDGLAEKRDDEDEEELDRKVEREWKHLVNSTATEAVVSKDPKALAIVEGFTM